MASRIQAIPLLLRSWFPPAGAGGETLCLIDFHDHTRGGHFGAWLRQFTLEFSERFDRVAVLTPRPWLTASLFAGRPGRCPRNILFLPLPRALARESRLSELGRIPALRKDKLHAFVMWGKDLKQRAPFHEAGRIPWATLMGVSWAARGHDNGTARTEIELIKTFRGDGAYCGFLQPDNFLDEYHNESIWLPFCEPISLPETPTAQSIAVAKHAAGRRAIGFIGFLTGFRGLDEFLVLARDNPQTAFVAAGPLVRESVAPDKRHLLDAGALPNLLLIEGFIDEQEVLSSVVNAVDAVFIDGRAYPVHSSIVCRALRLGKAVVTTTSDSWTADLVKRWGVGVQYRSPCHEISAALDAWRSGTEGDICRAAADRLSDSAALEKCFDEVTHRLQDRSALLRTQDASNSAKPSRNETEGR